MATGSYIARVLFLFMVVSKTATLIKGRKFEQLKKFHAIEYCVEEDYGLSPNAWCKLVRQAALSSLPLPHSLLLLPNNAK